MDSACVNCNEPFAEDEQAVTVRRGKRTYSFCSEDCRDSYGFRRLTNRICSREVCNNQVPEGYRMLCPSCHQKGSHLGECEVMFDKTELAKWARMDQMIHNRIEEGVRIYSCRDMTQEELRSLVPSLQGEAA